MRALILIAGLAAASSAGSRGRAMDPARAEAVLDRGQPWVEVRPDAEQALRRDPRGISSTSPRPLAVVWTVMTDCDPGARRW